MSGDDDLDLARLARNELRFRKRVLEVPAGAELRVEASWDDSIVFVEVGEVEVECVAGEQRRFATGAILCLAPSVSGIRNRGSVPVRLVIVSRRTRSG